MLVQRDVKYPSFGAFLRQLRKSKGWTQEEAARKLNVPQPTWAGYEQGRRFPRDNELLHRITEVFGIPFEELRKRLPQGVVPPRERLHYYVREYRRNRKQVGAIGEQLATGDPTHLLPKLNSLREKMKKITRLIEKTLFELYPLRPIPVIDHLPHKHPYEMIDIDPDSIVAVVTVPEEHSATVAAVASQNFGEIKAGDYVLLDTVSPPRPTDVVFARLSDGEIELKRYQNGDNVCGIVRGIFRPAL